MRVLSFVLFVLFSVLIQVSVFSSWNFWGATPQLPVLVVFFYFLTQNRGRLWWFVFLYYLLLDLLTPGVRPGLLGFLVLLFLCAAAVLRGRFLKRNRLVSFLVLVIISVFFSLIAGQSFELRRLFAQTILNFIFFLILYLPLSILVRFFEAGSPEQLKIKL